MLDLNKNEEEILRYWDQNKIMEEVRAKNAGKKKFYFLDGPPFVSGDLHPGQIWVKAVKDATLRYKRYKGFDVHDKAGYDVHGLPIENRIERNLGITSKKEIETKIGVEKFVAECLAFVKSYIGHMDTDYKRFGVSLDFANPYLPFKNEYMESAWSFLKVIDGKGLLYKGRKPMPFCPHCGTAVAQGSVEVEYKDETDPSIFIAFEINKELTRAKANARLDENTYLLVWTTTPWTIPANIAIAANPKEIYVKAKIAGRKFILAKKRLDAITELLGESAIIEGEFYGSELDGTYYIHPLESKITKQKEFRVHHKIVFSEEIVSGDEGSGLVHIAPGHGPDDYSLGLKNNFPLFSPVDENALYTKEADAYAGLRVPDDANKKIIEDLGAAKVLVARTQITHSYPHCWRCETKLIYMATDQWFINIQKVKKKLLAQSNKVIWHPEEAKAWEEDVLSKSPDWTLSRQRYWGTPMPIWVCTSCNEYTVIGSMKELNEKAQDKAALSRISDLHRPGIDSIMTTCDKCGAPAKRIPDIFDVWFDSSIAYRASLTQEEFDAIFPIDFILEGRDQIRAWFSYQLKMGTIVNGRRPFNHVGVDGMLLAEDGRQMHKHLGNYVSLADLLKITSADGYRLWCTDHTPWLDLQFSSNGIKEADKALQLLYNVSKLITEYSDAIGYKPKRIKAPKPLQDMDLEDQWIISRLNETIKSSSSAFDSYEVYKAAYSAKRLLINDISRFYLKIAKKKVLYSDKRKAKATLDLINYIHYNLLILMSPIIPFSSEKIYLEHYGEKGKSIFLNKWPKHNDSMINKGLESDFERASDAITAILSSREKAAIKLRWPLSKATLEVNGDSVFNSLQKLSYIIEDYTNIKRLEIKQVDTFSTEVRPSFSKIGPDFKEKASAVAEALKSANADEMQKAIERDGYYPLHTVKGTVSIDNTHFTAIKKLQNENAISFKEGIAYVDKEISKELHDEAVLREFERGAQIMRKELQLKKPDRISIGYLAQKEISDVIKKSTQKIKKDINAKHITDSLEGFASVKEFEIDNAPVKIGIKKID